MECRCNSTVLFFGGWREIHTLDDERKMDFELASSFGESVRRIYARLGYQVVEVPRAPIEERVDFVLHAVALG